MKIEKGKVYKVKDSTLLVSIIEGKYYFTSLINGHQTEFEFPETKERLENSNLLEEIHPSWKEWLFI